MYTGTARGARDKYQVCDVVLQQVLVEGGFLEGRVFGLGGCHYDGGIVDLIQRYCVGGDDNDVVLQQVLVVGRFLYGRVFGLRECVGGLVRR